MIFIPNKDQQETVKNQETPIEYKLNMKTFQPHQLDYNHAPDNQDLIHRFHPIESLSPHINIQNQQMPQFEYQNNRGPSYKNIITTNKGSTIGGVFDAALDIPFDANSNYTHHPYSTYGPNQMS